MPKIYDPELPPLYEGCDEIFGLCVPVYNQVGNENLAGLMWSVQRCADVPYQISLGIGPNCVAKNRNKALARLDPRIKYILMSDDDVLASPHFASRMIAKLAFNPDIGAVSAVMMGPRGEAQNDIFPGYVGPLEEKETILPGTFFMYDRTRVNVEWDEQYIGSQWEDTDAIIQIREQGFRTLAIGSVQIMHRHKGQITGPKRADWEVNREYFLSKWGEEVLK